MIVIFTSSEANTLTENIYINLASSRNVHTRIQLSVNLVDNLITRLIDHLSYLTSMQI